MPVGLIVHIKQYLPAVRAFDRYGHAHPSPASFIINICFFSVKAVCDKIKPLILCILPKKVF